MARKASDHALALIKAVVNAVPIVGGPIASLIGDYVPFSTQRATEKAVEFLAEKLHALEGRIDVDAVDKDEFSELFKSCYLVIVHTHREEKLRAAAALIANLLLAPGDPAKIPYEEADHLVRCLDALSIGAIWVLGAVRKNSTSGGSEFSQLARHFPDMDTSLLMSLVSELRSLNLLRVQEPSISLADFANYRIELTPIGRRFIERFIEGKM